MITRIEISGFKSFTDFAVDLAPLTIIAGSNGTGKSNLFDALRLISAIASSTELNPLHITRGGLSEAFTKYDIGTAAEQMDLAVEGRLVAGIYPNNNKVEESVKFRYEITLNLLQPEVDGGLPYLTREQLAITQGDDGDFTQVLIDERFEKLGDELFISELLERGELTLNPSMLSRTYDEQQPLRAGVKFILRGLQLINPNQSIHFSNYTNGRENVSPSVVLKALVRASRIPNELGFLSQKVQQVVPEISRIKVYTDDFRRTSVTAEDTTGRKFLVDNLSEGTRRIIALTALYLQTGSGTGLLLEEPENGLDPRVLDQLLRLLLDFVTLSDDDYSPNRQVISTTHSPTLIGLALSAKAKPGVTSVLLSTTASLNVTLQDKSQTVRTTRMLPVILPDEKERNSPLETYTLHQAMNYLRHASSFDLPINTLG